MTRSAADRRHHLCRAIRYACFHQPQIFAPEMFATPLHNKSILLALVLITLFGAFLRVNAALHTVVQYPLRADAGGYFSYAYNIRHFGIYSRDRLFSSEEKVRPRPDAMGSPGYPIALLPFAGEQPTSKTILDITLMQSLLGTLMIPLTFLLGRALLPAAWALLPASLVAISPQLIIAGTFVLSETLFSFLLLAALVALVLQYRKPESWAHAIASGALLGMAALTRPTLQYFLPCVLLVLIPMLPKELRWRQGTSLCAGFAIIFVPWLLRNQWTLGMVSDPTLAISTILHGHYPDFMYRNIPESLGYPYRFDPRAQEISVNMATLLRELFARFREDPATYLRWYVFGKPIAFFSWGDVAAAGDIFTYPTMMSPYYDKSVFILTKEFMRVSHWVWVAAALLGIFVLWLSRNPHILGQRRRFVGLLLATVVLYFVAVHVVGFPIARYSIPLLSVIYVLSSCFLCWIVARFYAALRSRG